jgi:tetratricopeptide (TPR) repeat protein
MRTQDGPFEELVALAWLALRQQSYATAESLLQRAIDLNPGSADAHTLRGVVYAGLGRPHAAYHSYKTALVCDPCHGPALQLMRGYCERFGLDMANPRINPAARREPEPI